MKQKLLFTVFAFGLLTAIVTQAQSRFVTIFPTNCGNTVSLNLNTNETGRIVDGWLDIISTFRVIKNGQEIFSQSVGGGSTDRPTNIHAVTIVGPATFALVPPSCFSTYLKSYCTIEIIPYSTSFPPDKTLILPEGTVGVIHVESSTNLIDWQDEWVHTFGNTNQNRFFRLRAERSLP